MQRFSGKVALITGAAQGIGLATAKRFIAEGASVVGCDIRPEVVDTLGAIGAHGVVADVTYAESLENLLAHAIRVAGKIDVLVNNAGVTSPADFLDFAFTDFERVLRINVSGAFLLSQLCARHLVARKSAGAIVNVSSINGAVAIPKQTAYVTSKGALNQLTRVMAVSLATHGIRVNAVGPGTILTEMSRARVMATEESRQRMLSRTPLGRAGEVEEVASVIAFLASDDASYVTGQIVYIDGGRLALNGVVEASSA